MQKEFYTFHQNKLLTIFNKTQRNLKNVFIFTHKDSLFSLKNFNFTAIKLDYNVEKLDPNDTLIALYILYSLIRKNKIDLCYAFINAIQDQTLKNTVSKYFQNLMSKKKFSPPKNAPKLPKISDVFKNSSAFQFSVTTQNIQEVRKILKPKPISLILSEMKKPDPKKHLMLGQRFLTSNTIPSTLPKISQLFKTPLDHLPFSPIFYAKNFK